MSVDQEMVAFLPCAVEDGGSVPATAESPVAPHELKIGDIVAVSVALEDPPEWLAKPAYEERRRTIGAPLIGQVVAPLPEAIGDPDQGRWTSLRLEALDGPTTILALGRVHRNIGAAPGKFCDTFAAALTMLQLIDRPT